jgi:hypothetical protein
MNSRGPQRIVCDLLPFVSAGVYRTTAAPESSYQTIGRRA